MHAGDVRIFVRVGRLQGQQGVPSAGAAARARAHRSGRQQQQQHRAQPRAPQAAGPIATCWATGTCFCGG